jgi:cytochrome b561
MAAEDGAGSIREGAGWEQLMRASHSMRCYAMAAARSKSGMAADAMGRIGLPGDKVRRYGAVAQLLHWSIAILIVVMFGLGWYMADLPLSQQKFELYQLHKSLGLTVFLLALVRLGWRLTHPAPPWPAGMQGWERLAAGLAHWALYALILMQPMIGLLQSNAANFPIVLWGQVPLPAVLGPNEALAERLVDVHEWVARLILIIVLVHVAAALRHHFWLKDDVLRRMLPAFGGR